MQVADAWCEGQPQPGGKLIAIHQADGVKLPVCTRPVIGVD
jgi:hypothetical protein